MFNNLKELKEMLVRKGDQNRADQKENSMPSPVLSNEDLNPASAEGFLCPVCLAGFPCADELQNHYEINHSDGVNNDDSGRKTLNCPSCKMKHGSEIELQSHIQRHHASSKTESDVEALKEKIQALEGSVHYENEQLQDYIKENRLLRNDKDDLISKQNDLMQELTQLKADYHKATLEVNCLEEKIKSFSDYENLKKENEQNKLLLEKQEILLSGRASETEKLMCELENTKRELEDMKISREKLFSKIGDGDGGSIAMEELKQELHKLNDQYSKQKSIHDQVVEQLHKSIHEMSEHSTEMDVKLKQLCFENSNYKADLNDMNEKLKSFMCQNESLKSELTKMKHESDLTALTHASKLKEMADIHSDFKRQLEDKEKDLIKMKNELDMANKEKDSNLKGALKAEESFKQILLVKDELIKKKEEELNSIQKEMNLLSESKEEQKKEIEETKNLLKNLKSNLENANNYLNNIKIELSKKEEIILQLETKIQSYNEEQRMNLEEINKLSLELNEVKDMKNEIEKIMLEKNVEFKKKEENLKEKYEETIKELKTSLSDCLKRNENLLEQTHSLNEKLEEFKKSSLQSQQEHEASLTYCQSQIGVLNEKVKTLQELLKVEEEKNKDLNFELTETDSKRLELEVKLKILTDEKKGLLERCRKSEDDNENLLKKNSELRRKLDDTVAALQELGRENQTLQVEHTKHSGRKWADDAEVTHCRACGKLFTVTIRKHHCRNCGEIFCNECSSKTAAVASSRKPVRVCQVCYTELSK